MTVFVPKKDDFVSYHGSLTEYHGQVMVVTAITTSENDHRLVGVNERLSLRGIGANDTLDNRLRNVSPLSVTLVKSADRP